MTSKQFIEKAIEGGWKPELEYRKKAHDYLISAKEYETTQKLWNEMIEKVILLDPLAWQAMCKICGLGRNDNYFENRKYDYWQDLMHGMIDALCEGRTIESYLETL